MATHVSAPHAQRSWPVLRPLLGVSAAFAVSYPLGAKGLITPFLAFGVLGLGRAWRNPFIRRISLLAVLWSAVTIVSAYVHQDKITTQLGIYGVVVVLSVAGMWWLHDAVGLRRETLVILVGVGWFILSSQHGLLPNASSNSWKFALAAPTTMVCLGLAWRLRTPRVLLVAILGVIAMVSFSHDARFPMGLSVVVAAATLLHRHGTVTRASIVRQLVAFVAAVVAVILLYPPLAVRGYFGSRAQEQQSRIDAEGINFLFANRPELVQSAWIAAHHPVLGIGPGSVLTTEESNRALAYLASRGLQLDINKTRYLRGEADSELTSGPPKGYANHSSAINAVAQAGVLAAPFWLFYAFALIRLVLLRAREEVYAVPAVVWLSMLALWDVLFSPLLPVQWPELATVIFLAATAAASEPSASPQVEKGEKTAAGRNPAAMTLVRRRV